ncbi:MAG: DUF3299 domain-containing protein [Sphingomonadaceae bacterium]
MIVSLAALLTLSAQPADLRHVAFQEGPPIEDIWKPAATPPGGVSWSVLESTRETTRTDANGFIRAKPLFPPAVKALAGKRVKVAGFMMPLENSPRQGHFVLLAYPPGCPFHMHAGPNQFIEVKATTAFPVEIERAIVVEGVLELTGEDESGIFYRLTAARPG